MSVARDLLTGWRAQRARATVLEHADTDADALAERDGPSDPGALVGDDDEREAMREYYAASASGRAYRPTDDDPYRDGLLIASRMRPSAWSDPTPPTRGCWCAYCGNPQSGGRWWRPRNSRSDGLAPGEGWRCQTCRPIPPGCAVEVVET
jgi:hypothetical protein